MRHWIIKNHIGGQILRVKVLNIENFINGKMYTVLQHLDDQ
jgi:hypothetical protein